MKKTDDGSALSREDIDNILSGNFVRCIICCKVYYPGSPFECDAEDCEILGEKEENPPTD